MSVESSMATGHESQRNLKAILKWSLAQQGDGTQETHVDVEVGIIVSLTNTPGVPQSLTQNWSSH